ncbi:hypothetical protein A9Q99_00220 [Gammaproteobacteria bacterium 45_16_T64]|nr:hypothetical protein A9Q99_00220 [Gammaproteobacteria bacterium 45_16_T64]
MHGTLKGKIVAISALRERDKCAMYELMVRYYENTQWERFNKDLDEKQHVILLLAGADEQIKGFSTLMQTETEINGRKSLAIFSGDTVVDEAYWGQRVLGKKFLSYLLMQRVKNPLAPLYWLLISKGYKTYLLMANNFSEHYPRFESKTPTNQQKLMDAFAGKLFGDSYCAETGCCKFPKSLGQLREGVAHLEKEEVAGNDRIQFFYDNNPGWAQGDELVCIARMSWSMPAYYLGKSWWKLVAAPWVKQKSKATQDLAKPMDPVENTLERSR